MVNILFNELLCEVSMIILFGFSGFDINYELYSPLIQNFEIIKLEKRLDDNLLYLRDALIEYSTFPQDMIPERRVEGTEVPINPLQVSSQIFYIIILPLQCFTGHYCGVMLE